MSSFTEVLPTNTFTNRTTIDVNSLFRDEERIQQPAPSLKRDERILMQNVQEQQQRRQELLDRDAELRKVHADVVMINSMMNDLALLTTETTPLLNELEIKLNETNERTSIKIFFVYF